MTEIALFQEKDVPEIYKPLDWLSETMPRKAPYYPQMGDEVIYFRQGHKLYVDAVTSKKLYEISPKDIPWTKGSVKVLLVLCVSFVRTSNICFRIKNS